jgi:hypothetical protein
VTAEAAVLATHPLSFYSAGQETDVAAGQRTLVASDSAHPSVGQNLARFGRWRRRLSRPCVCPAGPGGQPLPTAEFATYVWTASCPDVRSYIAKPTSPTPLLAAFGRTGQLA